MRHWLFRFVVEILLACRILNREVGILSTCKAWAVSRTQHRIPSNASIYPRNSTLSIVAAWLPPLRTLYQVPFEFLTMSQPAIGITTQMYCVYIKNAYLLCVNFTGHDCPDSTMLLQSTY